MSNNEVKNSDKFITILGWIGTALSVAMYVFYLDTIQGNLASPEHDRFLQPLAASVNCTVWTCYGLFKTPRDLPIAFANMPGIIFGVATVISALV
jgi:integral membrane protein